MTSTALERITTPAPARVGQATAVEQSRAIAEVQAAIVVAQQCPRDILRAWADMKAACGRLGLAQRAFYAVPNRGSGPSVHLARELARIWGNIDYGVKELRRDDEAHESEVLAYAWDQQTNVRSTRSLVVPHARMSGKGASKTRELLVDLGDIYLNNQNVGARAVRETIFTVLPADFVAEAQEICRKTIERGDGKPLPERIAQMIQGFAGLHVSVGQIEQRVGRKRGQWTPVDLADLAVVFSSIQRGELTAVEAFPPETVTLEDLGPAPAGQPVIVPPTADTMPSLPPAETEQVGPEHAAQMASPAQTRRIGIAFTKLGFGSKDRDRKLGLAARVVQRPAGAPLASSSDLTVREASDLIDTLEAALGNPEPLTYLEDLLEMERGDLSGLREPEQGELGGAE